MDAKPMPHEFRTETQRTIREWASSAFGSTGSTLSRLLRGAREMTELLDEVMLANSEMRTIRKLNRPVEIADITQERRDRIAGEVADVVILIMDTAEAAGVTLAPLVTPQAIPSLSMMRRVVNANGAMAHEIDRACCVYDEPLQAALDSHLRVYVLDSIVFSMAHVAALLGTDLQALVDLKMRINRRRRWTVDANGNGSHVKGCAGLPRFGIQEASDWSWAKAHEFQMRPSADAAEFDRGLEESRERERVRGLATAMVPQKACGSHDRRYVSPMPAGMADAFVTQTRFCGCGAGGAL